MALGRRARGQEGPNIWPGFVDAMTALLLVLFFVLSIFMIVQFVLSETISGQDEELSDLAHQVAGLAEALGLETRRANDLDNRVGALDGQLSAANNRAAQQSAMISTLTRQRDGLQVAQVAANTRIAGYEEQVASLLASNRDLGSAVDTAQASLAAIEAANLVEIDEREAAQLALASARDEIDVQAEQARLAAARTEALRAMIADMESTANRRASQLDDMQNQIANATQALFLAEAAKRAAEQNITTLTAANANLQNNLSGDQTQLADALSELQAAQAELAAINAVKDALEDDYNVAELARIAALQRVAERDAQIARAQQANSSGSESLQESQANAERLALLLADKETAIVAAELALAERAAELDEAERDRVAEAAAAAAARVEIAVLEEARRVLEEDLSLAQMARVAVLQQLVSARNRAEAGDENLAAAQSAISDMETSADAAQVQISAANAELAAQQASTADAEANAQRLVDLLNNRDSQIAEVQQALADNEIDAAEAARRIDQANADLEVMTAATNRAQENARLLAELLEDREVAITAAELALAERASSLSDIEKAQLADAAAAEALRLQMADADAELTAMSLALEAERARAMETLTQLAAARAARRELETMDVQSLATIDIQQIALAEAQRLLRLEEAESADNQREVALLNQQTSALRSELNQLQGLLDSSADKDREAQIRIETLGAELNTALARAASEERARANAEQARADAEQARADAEARERLLAEAEAQDLRKFRSEFFGRMREVLGEREGVQIVGDRFVFSSEVLFAAGSADLGPDGHAQIARVAAVLRDVADEIPEGINWILRVDGHTDRTGLGSGSRFADNWELSQARALSVVRYLIESEGIPAERLAATGFGEFQPVNDGDSVEALSQNRRIELKFTEQ